MSGDRDRAAEQSLEAFEAELYAEAWPDDQEQIFKDGDREVGWDDEEGRAA